MTRKTRTKNDPPQDPVDSDSVDSDSVDDSESESQIQEAIKKRLGATGVLLFRRNSGNFYRRNGGRIKIGVDGEGDLNGFIPNQLCKHCGSKIHPLPFYLEVKRPGEQQSDDQVKFQNETCKRRGLLYFVATSADEAEKILAKHRTDGIHALNLNFD